MPAPSEIGSTQEINSTSQTGSTSITVPSGADLALLAVTCWENGTDLAMDTMTLGGSAFTEINGVKTGTNTYSFLAYLVSPSSGSQTFAWDTGIAAVDEGVIFTVTFFDDVNTGDPIRSSTTDVDSSPTAAFATDLNDLCFLTVSSYGADADASGTGQTVIHTSTTYNSNSQELSTKAGVSGTTTMAYAGSYDTVVACSIKGSTGATLEQEGFAFGDDDGNEASHTLGTQDTNLSAPLDTTKTIRLLANATGDPASIAYKLKYQKDGSGGYVDVPVGSDETTTPTFESGDVTESGLNSADATPAVAHPAYGDGDLVIQWLAIDDDDAITPPSTGPHSEALLFTAVNGDSGGADGPAICMIAWLGAATQTSGTVEWAIGGGGEQWTAMALLIPAGEFDAANPIDSVSAIAGEAGDSVNVPTPAWSCTDADGRVIVAMAVDADPQTATPPTGWTAPITRDRGAVSLRLAYRDAVTTASESISSVNFTITSDSSSTVGLVVNGVTTTNEVYIVTSSNIATGGEPTTARLAAPATKTTGDFDTGRRWDDENGSDSIDITDGDYTELEWTIRTQDPAATDDYFEFRLYAADVAFDTYTLTPKWTIGTGALNITPNFISSGATVYQPTITTGSVDITPNVVASSATVPQPTVTPGAVDITPDAIASASTVYEPTVTVGAADITPNIVASSAEVYEPTITTGPVDITPDLVASADEVYQPTVTPGAVDITPDAITSASTVYQPTLTVGAVDITPNLIASGAVVYEPTIGQEGGTQDITPNVITSAAVVYEPTVTPGAVDITPDAIASASTVYQPTIAAGAVDITPNTITSAAVVYQPTITVGAVDITPNLVSSTAEVYEPTVTQDGGTQAITPNLVTSVSEVYEPTITTGAVNIDGSLIASTAIVYEPTIAVGAVDITPDLISGASVVYEPTVTVGAVDITPDFITSGAVVYQPTVGAGLTDITPDIVESSAEVYEPRIYLFYAVPTDRTCVILLEDRTAAVVAESRNSVIPAETRTAVVDLENRTAEVAAEDRSILV